MVRGRVDVLARQWRDSAVRLDRRLDGLTDVEFLWEPAPGCWTLRPGLTSDEGWLLDYDEPAPEPPPLTTIAWRLLHLANGNWLYWEHAFGPGARMFTDLVMPRSADDARRYWRDSRRPITAWLDSASDDALDELRPSHDSSPRTAGDVVLILVDEQVHHGAEIALMRDLYRIQVSPSAGPGVSPRTRYGVAMASPFTITLRGYDVRQVDALLAQADEALTSGSETLRTSARNVLRTTTFNLRLRGYAPREVDDAVAQRLRALE
jgi:hypothetical protein